MTGICVSPAALAASTTPWPWTIVPSFAGQDRLANAEGFDAGADARDLRCFRPADATRRLAQFVDRHIGHHQLRQHVIAPLQGMVGNLGERALALPAGSRLGFQSRREAIGPCDGSFASVSVNRHWSLPLLGFRNLLSEKEEATTQPRDGVWASKQSIRPRGPRSHISERPDIRPSLVWNCRLAWMTACPRAAAIRGGFMRHVR
jgi:hypothetical protein